MHLRSYQKVKGQIHHCHILWSQKLYMKSQSNTESFSFKKIFAVSCRQHKTYEISRYGSVMIEVVTKALACSALAMTSWVDTTIKVTLHRLMNVSRGAIRCRDFRDCSDEEIIDALRSHKVISVKLIVSKRDKRIKPTNIIILTFNAPVPPKSVKTAYENLYVQMCILSPLRCYNCQKVGHKKSSCNRQAVCPLCGKEGHLKADFHDKAYCTNSSDNHPAFA